MRSSKPWTILILAILATIVGCQSGETVVTLTRDEIQARGNTKGTLLIS